MRAARVKAGLAKFRANQLIAGNAVPLYRKARSIEAPLAEGYLFILAHPRSGSTVLSHVLQSHEDIVGFGEHHESYLDDASLDALAARNAFFDRSPTATYRYTLDKIVWNHHEIADSVLKRPDTRFVFLMREPVATFDSYRRMFHDMTTDARRLQSYRTRIEGMIDLAERIGDAGRMTFLTYDELTGDTADQLATISEWLELESVVTPEYGLNAKSGSQSWGDPSEHIKAGTVIEVPPPKAEIDPDVLDEAQEVYRTGCERLRMLTTTERRPTAVPEAR